MCHMVLCLTERIRVSRFFFVMYIQCMDSQIINTNIKKRLLYDSSLIYKWLSFMNDFQCKRQNGVN